MSFIALLPWVFFFFFLFPSSGKKGVFEAYLQGNSQREALSPLKELLIPWVIHALGHCFPSALRRLCSARQWEATSAGNGLAAGSHSDGWRRRATGTRPASVLPAAQCRRCRACRQTRASRALPRSGSESPPTSQSPCSPRAMTCPSFTSFFLRGLTVLHPNSYLEKAAASQIKRRCGFFGCRVRQRKCCGQSRQRP